MSPTPAASAGQGQATVKAKRFVLGALTATLAAVAVVTASVVVLRPARVHLSVTRARISSSKSDEQVAGVVELLLTLAGNNTSKRAAVVYESMFLDVTNGSTGPAELGSFVSANLTTAMPVNQRRGEVAGFSATVLLVPGVWTDASGNWTTRNRFSVIVTAMARFKIGFARTRLFDIRLACRPVSFVPAAEDGDAASKLSGGAQDGLPVDCV